MTTIPANQLVQVNPSVIGAAGAALNVSGLMLTTSTRVPIGTVQSFPEEDAVGSYFGLSSKEAVVAGIYFEGFTGRTAVPAAILYVQYNTTPVSAYLRGGNISSVLIATLQTYTGSLSVTIDGVLRTGTPGLSGATSFSNAAEIIAAALGIEGPQVASIQGSIAGTTLTVSSVTSGNISVGDVVAGTGVTANTYVVGQISGTGGIGTYSVSPSQTALSGSMTLYGPAVAYDSISGAFVVSGTAGAASTITFGSGALASSLLLTAATGAVLSQGAAAATPAAFMNALIGVNQNWVNFMTMFDPDGGAGNTVKLAFAEWKDTQNDRFGYVCWDTDPNPTTEDPATTSLGYILENNEDSGTFLVWEPSDLNLAAFVCGAAASIDFSAINGRITFAYKWQAGLTAGVTTGAAAENLLANGYNFGGAYGAANQNFVWLQNGQVTGPFAWFDSYINQVYYNNQFQIALLNFLGTVKSVPYNAAGNSAIEQALAPVIAAGLNFGAWAPGTISADQANDVNTMAGSNISNTLQTQGWYLQVLQASAAVRAKRGSPPCTFFYLDRGSVQMINLSSVAVQ